MANLEETVRKLSEQMNKPGARFISAGKSIYSNADTGTAVYEVHTSNMIQMRYDPASGKDVIDKIRVPTDPITKVHYLVGNEYGYATSGSWVRSEASIVPTKIYEDGNKLVIEQKGTYTAHFGIVCEAGDCVFDKTRFTPYGAVVRHCMG